jgi:antagonist of KipI
MGYRLEGEKLLMKEKHEMVSTSVASGIIQVTHDGAPIILMADAQTTGGYPRIARVCSADMSKIAQKRPGEKIKFIQINEEESVQRYNELRRTLNRLKTAIEIPF